MTDPEKVTNSNLLKKVTISLHKQNSIAKSVGKKTINLQLSGISRQLQILAPTSAKNAQVQTGGPA